MHVLQWNVNFHLASASSQAMTKLQKIISSLLTHGEFQENFSLNSLSFLLNVCLQFLPAAVHIRRLHVAIAFIIVV